VNSNLPTGGGKNGFWLGLLLPCPAGTSLASFPGTNVIETSNLPCFFVDTSPSLLVTSLVQSSQNLSDPSFLIITSFSSLNASLAYLSKSN